MTPGDAYLFRHAIMRDTAYGLQLPSERAELHLHSIDSIERLFGEQLMPFAEELLEHVRLANDARHEEEGAGEELQRLEHRYLEMAIRHAREGYEVQAEICYLGEAIDHPLTSDPRKVDYAVRAGAIAHSTGDLETAVSSTRRGWEIAEQAGLEIEACEALLQLNTFLETAGRKAESPAGRREVIKRLHAIGTPRAQRIAWGIEAELCERENEYEKAYELTKRALDNTDEKADPQSRTSLLGQLSILTHKLARDDHGVSLAEEALRIAEETNDQRRIFGVLNQLGIIYVESSRQELAEQYYTRARDVALKNGAQTQAAAIAGNLGNLQYYFLGGITAAEEAHRTALEFFRETGNLQRQHDSFATLSGIMLSKGDYAAGEKCAREYIRLADRLEQRSSRALGLMYLALVSEPSRPPGECLEVFVESLRCGTALTASNRFRGWMELAEFLHRHGLVRASLEIRTALLHAFQDSRVGIVGEIMRGGLAGALLLDGEVDAARAQVENAGQATIWARVPHHYIRAVRHPRLVIRAFEQAGAFGLDAHRARLDEVEEILDAIRKTAATSEYRAYVKVAQALEFAETVVQELGAASAGKRPARLFYGHPPEYLSPPLRRALMTRLERRDPEAYNALQRENPELFERMTEGAVDPWLPWDTPAAELPGLGELFQALKKGDSAV